MNNQTCPFSVKPWNAFSSWIKSWTKTCHSAHMVWKLGNIHGYSSVLLGSFQSHDASRPIADKQKYLMN